MSFARWWGSLVQTLVAQPAVETLDVRVLRRLAWFDAVPVDASLLGPALDRIADEFGPVVAADDFWRSVLPTQPLRHARHVQAAETHADLDAQALSGQSSMTLSSRTRIAGESRNYRRTQLSAHGLNDVHIVPNPHLK